MEVEARTLLLFFVVGVLVIIVVVVCVADADSDDTGDACSSVGKMPLAGALGY